MPLDPAEHARREPVRAEQEGAVATAVRQQGLDDRVRQPPTTQMDPVPAVVVRGQAHQDVVGGRGIASETEESGVCEAGDAPNLATRQRLSVGRRGEDGLRLPQDPAREVTGGEDVVDEPGRLPRERQVLVPPPPAADRRQQARYGLPGVDPPGVVAEGVGEFRTQGGRTRSPLSALTASTTSAPTIRCFQSWETFISVDARNRVPIDTPWAPRANAAATPRPSAIPPAATGAASASYGWMRRASSPAAGTFQLARMRSFSSAGEPRSALKTMTL